MSIMSVAINHQLVNSQKDYQLSQEYCMILTIRDPLGTAPVYDEVTQQLTNENFVHHDVRVRNIIRLEGNAF